MKGNRGLGKDSKIPGDGDGWVEMVDDGFIGLVGPFYQKGTGAQLEFRFPTAGKHRNRRGVLQGGALMTFADRTMGVVVRAGSESEIAATLQLDVHFLDSVRIGEVVETRPVLVRSSPQLAFVSAELMVEARMVGQATGIWKKMGQRVLKASPEQADADHADQRSKPR